MPDARPADAERPPPSPHSPELSSPHVSIARIIALMAPSTAGSSSINFSPKVQVWKDLDSTLTEIEGILRDYQATAQDSNKPRTFVRADIFTLLFGMALDLTDLVQELEAQDQTASEDEKSRSEFMTWLKGEQDRWQRMLVDIKKELARETSEGFT